MATPIAPNIDPTERSMLRDTMIRVIPVARMATEAVWTDRFHRFRGVRNVPPDMKWKTVQMIRQRHQHRQHPGIDLGGAYQSTQRSAGESPPAAPVRLGELR